MSTLPMKRNPLDLNQMMTNPLFAIGTGILSGNARSLQPNNPWAHIIQNLGMAGQYQNELKRLEREQQQLQMQEKLFGMKVKESEEEKERRKKTEELFAQTMTGGNNSTLASIYASQGDYAKAAEAMMKGKQMPEKRERKEGDKIITEEWDPVSGTFVEAGSAPRWNPNKSENEADPYFQALQGVDASGKPYFYKFNARTGQAERLDVTPGALSTEVQGNVAEAKAEGKEVGKATGQAKAELSDRKANYDNLEKVVGELTELGKKSTYTLVGQARDTAIRQLGMEPTKSAVARAEYISKVDNEILPLLRMTFGAQFTAQEGQSLKATMGDPNKAPSEKEAVLRSFIATKKAQIESLEKRIGSPQSEMTDDDLINKYIK